MQKKIEKIFADRIDLVVYDFDGVMTDNKVLVFENGQEAAVCSRADGMAIAMIKRMGIPQVVISTERNSVVQVRVQKLNIKAIYGVKDKRKALVDYCRKAKYSLDRVVYVGNDINDFEAMQAVGYPIAPADAHKTIRRLAVKVISVKGGQGVIRELVDMINDGWGGS